MTKKNLSVILKNLNKLAHLMRHPAVERGLFDYVEKLRIGISKDSSDIQELVEWFDGMGSFIDNEYFDLFYFQPHSSKPDIRVKEWDTALRNHYNWYKAYNKITIAIAMQLKKSGYESSGIDKWLHILKKDLEKPYSPPYKINIDALEMNLQAYRNRRQKK